ncbi:MAG: right-handed parallel beta-helix repeat-containing protein, partial [Pirellulaceae bacterium]|nr:right-handed parallel beta-helix repeat-containing protein [Pirellulaceae bacterium]
MKFLISIVALLIVAGAQALRPKSAGGGGNPILNVLFERDDFGGWAFAFSPRGEQDTSERQAAAPATGLGEPSFRRGDPSRPAPEQLLQQFDRNNDDRISREEAPERMRPRWDQIDTDHDGFITIEELKARDARVAGMENHPGRAAPSQPASEAPTVPFPAPGTRAYVNAAQSTGAHDGRSWETAFTSVQDALAAGAAEIWVARGTYTPGPDRNATFQLAQGGALYGGFAGHETQRDQRDWQGNPTILDGRGAYHVVTGADHAVLDGFVITGGSAMGGEGGSPPGGGGRFPGGRPPMGAPRGQGAAGRPIHMTPQAIMGGSNNGSGAGMLNFHASPTVRNCIFENNQAGKGGAVYNMTSTSFPPRPDASSKAPVFINCIFRKNTARGRGGGVSNDLGTAPTFLNCVFESNETPQKGGGMYNDFGCSPTLINCLFTGNSAQSAGGMGNDGGSSPVLYFCTFTNNHAVDYGAPLYQGTGPASNPSLIFCRITNNTCDWEGPGIYNWHDCAPRIKEATNSDAGYKPGRFTEVQLPQLLSELRQYRAQPAREPFETAPERVPSSERIVFANAAAGTAGDGRSWTTAYSSLHDALADAGEDGAEVRVASGIYRLGADRSESFVLHPGIRLYGGFNATDGQRDPAGKPTVLDGNGAYHVLIGANGAVLDGFTITGGCANGTGYEGKGGGLINYRRGPQSRPNSEVVTGFAMTFNHCLFTNNYARDGGAVYSYDRAKPVFTDCVFAGNRSENGGAVLDRVGVESTFASCKFTGNTARWRGGAVYFDYGSHPKLTDCVFRENTTDGHGGAVFSVSRASQLENTIVTLKGCRFENNTAKGDGGGAAFYDSSISVVQNCSFVGNQAGKEGNDIYTDASSSQSASDAALPSRSDEPQRAGLFRGEGAGAGVGRGRPGGPMGENVPIQFRPGADFSVVILGSGSPQFDPKRSGPSALIQYRGQYFLVDMGNGTQARLYELGVSLRDIAAIMLTHHHLDHNEEFIPILVYQLLRGRNVDVIGPPGTERYVGFARAFYAEDMAY